MYELFPKAESKYVHTFLIITTAISCQTNQRGGLWTWCIAYLYPYNNWFTYICKGPPYYPPQDPINILPFTGDRRVLHAK